MSRTRTTALRTALPGVPVDAVWDWHDRPSTFERLVPPWVHVALEATPDAIEPGALATFTQRLGPARLRWTSEVVDVTPGSGFVDEATQSPFAAWRHTHRFVADTAADGTPVGSALDDTVAWAAPGGALGGLAAPWLHREVGRLLAWRHKVTAEDLERLAPWRDQRPLRVAITGASGLVGTALATFLRAGGHTVIPVVRGTPGPRAIGWDPARGHLDPNDLEGLDGVVHLAGEPIAGGRWTDARKQRIVDSRVLGTDLLARAVAACVDRPRVLVSASAVGYYGHRDAPVDEDAPAGAGFLAETAVAWEAAAEPARRAGVRVVHPRIGLVLSARGGALPAQLPLFRAGFGGPLGNGRQGYPWVALDDLVGILHRAVVDPHLDGPINAVAPEPIDQRTFARTLARVLRRPALMPAPAPAVRLLLGELGERVLLEGAPVLPTRLRDLGFTWYRGDLDAALRLELGRFVP